MEDVIFQERQEEALVAGVTIFDNSDNTIPLDYSE